MALRDFTDKEMMVLQQMAADWMSRTGANARKPEKLTGNPSEAIGQVNDTYIARVDEDGIPALNPQEGATGSSTALDDDTAGSAVCAIWKIGKDGIMIDTGLTRRVWNVAETEIAESWVVVHRTKFGQWVTGVGGGGGTIVLFEILSVDFSCCDQVQVIVIGGPCEGTPVTDDELTVFDEAGCFFGLPEEEFNDLVGRRGFATKLLIDPLSGSATSTASSTSTSTAECVEAPNCRWVVFQLCCGEPL